MLQYDKKKFGMNYITFKIYDLIKIQLLLHFDLILEYLNVVNYEKFADCGYEKGI